MTTRLMYDSNGDAVGVGVDEVQVVNNILPNSKWQVSTAMSFDTLEAYHGNGVYPPLNVSAYTTGDNLVVCSCADTFDLGVGVIGYFSAAAHANMKLTAVVVTAVVANTSFTVRLPQGLLGAASAACTFTPIQAGGLASVGTGDAFDGWGKTTTLQVWRASEQGSALHTANLHSMCNTAAGVLKTEATAERMYHVIPAVDVRQMRGVSLAFGVPVMIKRGTNARWRVYINVDGSFIYSDTVSGSEDTYQWREVTRTIPTTAAEIHVGIEFLGDDTDRCAFYVAYPTCGKGTLIGTNNYIPRGTEILRSKVHANAASYINRTLTFPTVLDSGGSYGFVIDWHADTYGAIFTDIKGMWIQMEGTHDTAGGAMAMRDQEANPQIYGSIMGCQVATIKTFTGNNLMLLDSDGTSWIYGGTSGMVWTNFSIDVNAFLLS
jgi:hypothetical protein